MKDSKFAGVGVALVTPFTSKNSVDYNAFERLLAHVTEGGVDYLVVHGTTSEAPTLSVDEKKETLDFVKKNNPNNLPIVAGVSGNDTQKLISYLREADLDGVDALLSATPYYNKPSQLGLIRHYAEIAEASPLPIILYNVPSRTSCNMEASTTLELARNPKIVAIKEASGNNDQCAKIASSMKEDFMLLSGEDMQTLPILSIGGVGVISVVANALPAQFSQMVRSFRSGDLNTSSSIFKSLVAPIELLFKEGNPTGVKQMLSELGITTNHTRLPLTPASEVLAGQISEVLSSLGIKKGG